MKVKVIIPTAGLGARLRPHTHTTAKPLLHVAGKPVLGHILDNLVKQLDIDEVIFVTGHLGEQIEQRVKANYGFKASFVEQKELLGQAHAIACARSHVKPHDHVLIWFVDTISDAKLGELADLKEDGLVYVKEVQDVSRFGVVLTDKNSMITGFVEKPKKPIASKLVNIGLYFVKDGTLLMKCIDELMKEKMQTKGEYYLVDALGMMIHKGSVLVAKTVSVWEDCGKPDALLKTNRYFLDSGAHYAGKTHNSVIIEPVFIEPTARVENSVIGPHASVAAGAVVRHSIITDSIINEHAEIEKANLVQSIVASHAKVTGTKKKVNVGEHSEVSFS